jgi:hypothetical protein
MARNIMLAICLIGPVTAVVQWWLFRPYLPAAWKWLVAGVAGGLIGVVPTILAGLFLEGVDSWLALALTFAVIGITAGVAQAAVLNYHVRRASTWVLAQAAGVFEPPAWNASDKHRRRDWRRAGWRSAGTDRLKLARETLRTLQALAVGPSDD